MELFFRTFGEEQPIIILHGLFGSSDNWNTLAKTLSENTFKVFTIDLRNHGQSPHSEDMSYELMAKDITEFIQKYNIQKPILMGHSMGGKVAMYVDYLYPNILQQLIVVDIALKAYPENGHSDVFAALNAVDFNVIKTRRDTEQVLREYLQQESVIQFLLKNVYWQTSDTLAWRFNLSAIQKHYKNIITQIPFYTSNTKTTFIKGENSAYILQTDIEDIKQQYSQIQFYSIKDAGHWVHADQPKVFLDIITSVVTR